MFCHWSLISPQLLFTTSFSINNCVDGRITQDVRTFLLIYSSLPAQELAQAKSCFICYVRTILFSRYSRLFLEEDFSSQYITTQTMESWCYKASLTQLYRVLRRDHMFTLKLKYGIAINGYAQTLNVILEYFQHYIYLSVSNTYA